MGRSDVSQEVVLTDQIYQLVNIPNELVACTTRMFYVFMFYQKRVFIIDW